MENQLENVAPQQGSDDAAALESLFNKYKTRDEKSKRLSKEQILAKYFNPRQDTEIFRALPKQEGGEVIEEGYFHKVQAGEFISNTTAVYCPAKNNPKVQAVDKDNNPVFDQQGKPQMVAQYCALCAKSAKIKSKLAKGVPKKDNIKTPIEQAAFDANKKILSESNKYEAKLYYIIRGIDRGAEKDGVKFWRFKQNFKNQGVHDKLWKPIILNYYRETGKVYNSVEHGIDLMISVVDNSIPGQSRTFRDVSSIIPRQPSKLHTDSMIMNAWLADKTTWRDVFKPKKAPGIDEAKYLELAAEEREKGGKYDLRNTPYYNEKDKKWVFPNHPDLEAAANTRTQNLDASDEDVDLPDDDAPYQAAVTNVVNQASKPEISDMSTGTPTQPKFDSGAVELSKSASAYDDLPF